MADILPFRRRTRLSLRHVLLAAPLFGALAGTAWHYAAHNTTFDTVTVLRGGGGGSPPAGHGMAEAPAPPAFAGRVVRVIDGDTFRLDCCGASIRLWGIDAPERREAAGPAATKALRALIAGRRLACRRRDIDGYGRLVGQCALPDGSDLGRRLLDTGTVQEYCHFSGNHYGSCGRSRRT